MCCVTRNMLQRSIRRKAQPQSQGSVVAQTDWVVPPIVRQFVNIKLVLINPNNDLKSRIGKTSNAKFNQCYLTLHVELLLSTGYNWTEYIEYLNSGLRKHVSSNMHSHLCNIVANLVRLYRTSKLVIPQ